MKVFRKFLLLNYAFIWGKPRGLRRIILTLLSRKEMSGAEIIESIENMTWGYWRPSPGSVYPLLKELEAEGLIEHREVGNVKVYRLTEKGKKELTLFYHPIWFGEMPRGIPEIIEVLEGYAEYLVEKRDEVLRDEKLRERIKKIVEILKKNFGD
ncbi:MAG: PadR family transcriptional regulator [Sulfolobaceae archaeon]